MKAAVARCSAGILHPHESQREGKKDRNKDIATVSYSKQMCQYFIILIYLFIYFLYCVNMLQCCIQGSSAW